MDTNRARADDRNVYIVIPAFNQEESISAVVRSLISEWPNVVVVDDGSSDETGQAAAAAGAVLLRHPINRGQGAALQTGITYSLLRGAAFVVTFDGDGQHRASDVGVLLQPLFKNEADAVLGSRFLGSTEGLPLHRRIILKTAVAFTRISSGLAVTDTHNGLRALNRSAAEKLHVRLDRMAHASEVLDQIRMHTMRVREVPVHIRYTSDSLKKGQSSTAAARILFNYIVGRWFR